MNGVVPVMTGVATVAASPVVIVNFWKRLLPFVPPTLNVTVVAFPVHVPSAYVPSLTVISLVPSLEPKVMAIPVIS